jgi:hypothetical protein
MQKDSARCAQRTVGRVFSKGGRLHLVLEVDSGEGVAKVSCRIDDKTQVIFLPITEVIKHLGNSITLKLDGLSSDETEERVIAKGNRWFFKAREGEHGPFANEQAAKRALKHHILSAQEEGRTGRPARAMSG